MISIDKDNFNIEHILESGQCFRWNKLSNGNIGFITDEKYFELIDNKTMILLQCNLSYFEGLTIDSSPFKFSFPNAKTISELSLKDIRDCGVGYRDEYIKAAAQWYLSNTNKSITKNDVLEIPGVGKKVSNCIGLFGLHDLSCCPIDVWMQKIIDNRYNGKLPAWMDSEYAGVYQQYVFMYERFISKNR